MVVSSVIKVQGKSEFPGVDYDLSLDNEEMSNMTLHMLLARINPG